MSARGTILLVEDEAIIALAQARDVHAEGYSVIIAGSGAEAIAKVEEEGSAIDLVLMDIDLGPGMDGTEAAQEILKRRDLPVVFLSSHMERGVVERTERITSYGYVRKGSGIMALSASIKMAFKLWDAHRSIDEKNRRIEAASAELIRSWNEIVGREEALARSEARFRSMVENGADAFTLVDSEGKVSYEGPTVERLTGYTPEERAGASGFDNVHPDDLPAARAAMGRVMAVPDASASLEFRSIRKDGTVWWTQGTAVNRLHDPDLLAIVVNYRDVTAQKAAEEALRQSEARYRLLSENTNDSVWLADMAFRLSYMSPSTTRMRGFTQEEINAVPIQRQMTEESLGRAMALLDEVTSPENLSSPEPKLTRSIELELYRKDGSTLWMEIALTVLLDAVGRPAGLLGHGRDISRRKRTERVLEASLGEKELLLREVQHRVKNNLFIIASLLSLEMDKLVDEASREVFRDAILRVKSMGAIYEQLYRSDDFERIELRPYVEDLSRQMLDVLAIDSGRVTLGLDLADVSIETRKAVPLGLALNELMTNALKYAYPAGASGEIRVSLESREGQVLLGVYDDGPGFSRDDAGAAEGGLGLQLVEMLARQLGGEFSLGRGPGTRAELRFPGAAAE